WINNLGKVPEPVSKVYFLTLYVRKACLTQYHFYFFVAVGVCVVRVAHPGTEKLPVAETIFIYLIRLTDQLLCFVVKSAHIQQQCTTEVVRCGISKMNLLLPFNAKIK